jgi:hypothetical protein
MIKETFETMYNILWVNPIMRLITSVCLMIFIIYLWSKFRTGAQK